MVVIEKFNKPTNEKKLSDSQIEKLNQNKAIFEGNLLNKVTTQSSSQQENVNSNNNGFNLNGLEQILPLLNLIKDKNDKTAISELLIKKMFGDNPMLSKIFEMLKTPSTNNSNSVLELKKEDTKISSFKKTSDEN